MGEGWAGGPEFSWPVRVYYEDTDAGGVVYYANYLRFMERARTEYLRRLGFEQDRLADESGLLFAVRAVTIDYRRPARFNDALEVATRVSAVGRASVRFEQSVRRPGPDGVTALLCEATVQVACLDRESFRPRPLPPAIVEAMRLER